MAHLGYPYFNPYSVNTKPAFAEPINLYSQQLKQKQMYQPTAPEEITNNLPSTNQNISAGIEGITGMLGVGLNAANMKDEANLIQTKGPKTEYDAFGHPVYNQGEFAASTDAIKPRGASTGEVLGSAGAGAKAGAALGSIIPGIGNVAGAIAGGVIGGAASLLGGNSRRKAMRKARIAARKNLKFKQAEYNKGVTNFNEQEAALQQYQDQQDTSNRMYYLYGNQR